MEKLRLLAVEMGIDLEKIAAVPATMDKVSEGNASQPVDENGKKFDTRIQDAKVTAFTCDQYPSQHQYRLYWSALCQKVSAASGNPKKAFVMMNEIESLGFEELAEDNGMEVLWQKLRYQLQCTIKRFVFARTKPERRRIRKTRPAGDCERKTVGMDDASEV